MTAGELAALVICQAVAADDSIPTRTKDQCLSALAAELRNLAQPLVIDPSDLTSTDLRAVADRLVALAVVFEEAAK